MMAAQAKASLFRRGVSPSSLKLFDGERRIKILIHYHHIEWGRRTPDAKGHLSG